MRAETLWNKALATADTARATGHLVPLSTELVEAPALAPFQLRRLISRTPKHLRGMGPQGNPFLPWEPPLEVARPSEGHVLILNKYPVQAGHVLLITDHWAPQDGWLDSRDWAAVAAVAGDTGGLWFFNSCRAAGASQPHRHLQLLPRRAGEPSCPLDEDVWAALTQRPDGQARERFPWACRLSRRRDGVGHGDLEELYLSHLQALGLGDPRVDPRPLHPYNLLFDDRWFVTVRRCREGVAGFSVNALGFAGCLLQTEHSDLEWLRRHGPWALLQAVATPDLQG